MNISVSKARKMLAKEGEHLTDNQIEETLVSLYGLAEAFYSLSECDTNKLNGREKAQISHL